MASAFPLNMGKQGKKIPPLLNLDEIQCERKATRLAEASD
jgi:hypothetical protein